MIITVILTNLTTIAGCLYSAKLCKKLKCEDCIPAGILLSAGLGMIVYGLCTLIF